MSPHQWADSLWKQAQGSCQQEELSSQPQPDEDLSLIYEQNIRGPATHGLDVSLRPLARRIWGSQWCQRTSDNARSWLRRFNLKQGEYLHPVFQRNPFPLNLNGSFTSTRKFPACRLTWRNLQRVHATQEEPCFPSSS